MTRLSPETLKLASEMEDQAKEHVHMPTLPQNYAVDRYFNIAPAELSKASLRGKVVLLDIWDYTCVNCIRTLPYIKSWAEKYKDKGLVIIGIHSPEFDFEKNSENLKAAIQRFGLTYPVIADNEYEIWDSLANKYWPAKYLFDKDGILRTTHTGEGQYQEFEAFLQKILLERDSTITLPPLMPIVRSSDKPGSVCYRPTPETYIGYQRNHLGNSEELVPDKITTFRAPANLKPDLLYLDGAWKVAHEFAAPAGKGMSSLLIDYQAKEVNLVVHPQSPSGFRVLVEQDGKPIPTADRGSDVSEEGGKTYISIKEPRMYNVINNSKFGHFLLRITSDDPSFGAYAYTFTTDCRTE
ncbi:MAG: redoxin domain-containing protein [Bacteroidota bacterium]|nr:redoxin domain-containing protein [Bacteroidota bacterium]